MLRGAGREIRNPKSQIRNGRVGGIPNSEFRIPNSCITHGTLSSRFKNCSGDSKPVMRKTSSPPASTITVGTPSTP